MMSIARLVCASVVLLVSIGLSFSVNAQNMMNGEKQNKAIIQQAFDRWAAGTGNFFDLLTDDVQWTITGSSAFSKTYTNKKQFIDQSVTPLSIRLAKPIKPTVRQLLAEGDVVVAVWDGVATAKDGKPYRNTYNWVMTMKGGRITRVTAFLDMVAYTSVIQRVPASK